MKFIDSKGKIGANNTASGFSESSSDETLINESLMYWSKKYLLIFTPNGLIS
jgi:hypothetical protein